MIFKPTSWYKRPAERRSRLVQRFPRFSNRQVGTKDPLSAAADWFRGSQVPAFSAPFPLAFFPRYGIIKSAYPGAAQLHWRNPPIRVQRGCFRGMHLRVQRSCLGRMRLRVQRGCFGGMRLRVQCSCLGETRPAG